MLYGLGVIGIMHFHTVCCMYYVWCILHVLYMIYCMLHDYCIYCIWYCIVLCILVCYVLLVLYVLCVKHCKCSVLHEYTMILWEFCVKDMLCMLNGSYIKNMLCVHWMWVMSSMCIEYTASMLHTLFVLCHFVRIVYIVGCVMSTVCIVCNIHHMYAVSHIYVACFVLY